MLEKLYVYILTYNILDEPISYITIYNNHVRFNRIAFEDINCLSNIICVCVYNILFSFHYKQVSTFVGAQVHVLMLSLSSSLPPSRRRI